MNDARLFDFESDFVATLRCIPMAVRFKLDRCGIKLSLRQWSRFSALDRRVLLWKLCDAPADIAAYRDHLIELVAARTNEQAKVLVEEQDLAWRNAAAVAPTVINFAAEKGLAAPSVAQWGRLTNLERFVLVKLTRDNHDNVNFAPAMIEFGLAAGPSGLAVA